MPDANSSHYFGDQVTRERVQIRFHCIGRHTSNYITGASEKKEVARRVPRNNSRNGGLIHTHTHTHTHQESRSERDEKRKSDEEESGKGGKRLQLVGQ